MRIQSYYLVIKRHLRAMSLLIDTNRWLLNVTKFLGTGIGKFFFYYFFNGVKYPQILQNDFPLRMQNINLQQLGKPFQIVG